MHTNIKPTAIEPWRQLIEVLEFHEHETIQCKIRSKDKSLFTMQVIYDMKLEIYKGHIISISSHDIEQDHVDISLQKESILKVKSTYFLEENVWRKDGFEIECKNDIRITIDILD
ncbi:hypothetical protein [Bacillus anthracis]|uniref:hypothetical protein n=1 Tax=Bacillus anthracis TaxID=1392 RepID=UPI0009CAF9B1|nr:hypothetical protein [Bacillus anthracis]OPD56219.1 hypothetical protein BVG01_25465 [Bacillus anthracis]